MYWIAFRTLAIKELLRFLRIWIQTILPAVVTTTLYFLIFGTVIGNRIGDMNGISYLNYIAPGVILMAVISNSYANTVSSFYQSKFGHYIEELLIAPIPYWVIFIGFVCGGIMRGIIVGIAVSIVSIILTGIQIQNYFISILILILTATLFSIAGFINAVFATSFDDISIFPTFVLTPLTYLGGVFYSIHILSEPWHTMSFINPIFYMVSAFRYGVLGIADINLTFAISVIIVVIVSLTSFSLWLLSHGIGIKT
jgi:ABC-2 type transport system permease protein